MPWVTFSTRRGESRFPRGKRGLKFFDGGRVLLAHLSLPSREAWIEIKAHTEEIRLTGRFPRGKRGLKFRCQPVED